MHLQLKELRIPTTYQCVQQRRCGRRRGQAVKVVGPLRLKSKVVASRAGRFTSVRSTAPAATVPSRASTAATAAAVIAISSQASAAILPSTTSSSRATILPIPSGRTSTSISSISARTAATSPSPVRPAASQVTLRAITSTIRKSNKPVPSTSSMPVCTTSSTRPSCRRSRATNGPHRARKITGGIRGTGSTGSTGGVRGRDVDTPAIMFKLLNIVVNIVTLIFKYVSPSQVVSLFSPGPRLLATVVYTMIKLVLMVITIM